MRRPWPEDQELVTAAEAAPYHPPEVPVGGFWRMEDALYQLVQQRPGGETYWEYVGAFGDRTGKTRTRPWNILKERRQG